MALRICNRFLFSGLYCLFNFSTSPAKVILSTFFRVFLMRLALRVFPVSTCFEDRAGNSGVYVRRFNGFKGRNKRVRSNASVILTFTGWSERNFCHVPPAVGRLLVDVNFFHEDGIFALRILYSHRFLYFFIQGFKCSDQGFFRADGGKDAMSTFTGSGLMAIYIYGEARNSELRCTLLLSTFHGFIRAYFVRALTEVMIAQLGIYR